MLVELDADAAAALPLPLLLLLLLVAAALLALELAAPVVDALTGLVVVAAAVEVQMTAVGRVVMPKPAQSCFEAGAMLAGLSGEPACGVGERERGHARLRHTRRPTTAPADRKRQ